MSVFAFLCFRQLSEYAQGKICEIKFHISFVSHFLGCKKFFPPFRGKNSLSWHTVKKLSWHLLTEKGSMHERSEKANEFYLAKLCIMFNFRFVNLVAKYTTNQINGKRASVAAMETEREMINTQNHWDVTDGISFLPWKSCLFAQKQGKESYSSTYIQ